MRRRLGTSVTFTLLFINSCYALRSLRQNGAYVPALSDQGPAAGRPNIQLNAPGTSTLLSAPVVAPANAPIPGGTVSLAATRNTNGAAEFDDQDSLRATQQSYASTTVPVWPPPLLRQRQHGILVKAEACWFLPAYSLSFAL
jgi:hypothetical protein